MQQARSLVSIVGAVSAAVKHTNIGPRENDAPSHDRHLPSPKIKYLSSSFAPTFGCVARSRGAFFFNCGRTYTIRTANITAATRQRCDCNKPPKTHVTLMLISDAASAAQRGRVRFRSNLGGNNSCHFLRKTRRRRWRSVLIHVLAIAFLMAFFSPQVSAAIFPVSRNM